jgi:hypothetical protein
MARKDDRHETHAAGVAQGAAPESAADPVAADPVAQEAPPPAAPSATITMKAPAGACDVCFDGETYPVAKDGTVKLPRAAERVLVPLGFRTT